MGNLLRDIQRLCDAGEWCAAFDHWRTYPTTWLKRAEHRDAWLALLCGETRLLHHACAQAVTRGQTAQIRAWYADLLLHGAPSLVTRFRVVQLHPQHIDAVIDLLRAAGLALTARAITETPHALSGLENLCGWLNGVSQDEPDDAPVQRRLEGLSRRRSASETAARGRVDPAAVLEALIRVCLHDAAHPRHAIRLARIGERAHAWLGVPVQVPGGPVRVPLAYVMGAPGAEVGRADQTLVVDMITPGTGRAFQHADDVLLLDPERQTGGFDADFVEAMQHAFTTACALADRTSVDVDARWRVMQGQWPLAAGTGGSASGQALLAFYGALTGTIPDPGVIVLAQVTADGHLEGVDQVAAKTRALIAAVQAQYTPPLNRATRHEHSEALV